MTTDRGGGVADGRDGLTKPEDFHAPVPCVGSGAVAQRGVAVQVVVDILVVSEVHEVDDFFKVVRLWVGWRHSVAPELVASCPRVLRWICTAPFVISVA